MTPRASKVLGRGSWSDPTDTITLSQDQRHRRRIMLTSDGGIEFLLDLAEATHLRHGDGLVLDDGRVIEVRAEAEELLEVRGTAPHHLLRLAWHLGNRHLEAEIAEDRILIRRDHVIADMLEKLGATVVEVVQPFNPEGGAYGGAHESHHTHHTHEHGHGQNHHGHDHDH